jgi:uncharacterized protein (TIGR02145 family)
MMNGRHYLVKRAGWFILCFITEFTSQGQTFQDGRDGRLYRMVQVGQQCWMAENLNHGVIKKDFRLTDNGIAEKTCYGNDDALCNIYGGLYTWPEAMAYDTGSPQGICPDGWHIPGTGEWNELSLFLGEEEAGKKMKVDEKHIPAWDGTNESGFTALPSGCGHDSVFSRLGHWAVFWSSSTKDNQYPVFIRLDRHWAPGKYHKMIMGDYYLKSSGFSIRCIKNTPLCEN